MLLYLLATVTHLQRVVDSAIETAQSGLAGKRSGTASPQADRRGARQPDPATAIIGSVIVSPTPTVTPSGIQATAQAVPLRARGALA